MFLFIKIKGVDRGEENVHVKFERGEITAVGDLSQAVSESRRVTGGSIRGQKRNFNFNNDNKIELFNKVLYVFFKYAEDRDSFE